MMNNIIRACVEKLSDIVSKMKLRNAKDTYSDGYDAAIYCIKDGIEDRIGFISYVYDEENDSSTAYGCEEQINSLIRILHECADKTSEKVFDVGFRDAVREFTQLITPIIEWLSTYI